MFFQVLIDTVAHAMISEVPFVGGVFPIPKEALDARWAVSHHPAPHFS
jgi:hypothetical protein